MDLSQQLLDTLACPQCKGPLEYRRTDQQLACHDCKLAYAVRKGVPVLLIDEAIKTQ
ncbi:MAG: Trm112 family protein [Candidatus Zixiibacteriota bacterium]